MEESERNCAVLLSKISGMTVDAIGNEAIPVSVLSSGVRGMIERSLQSIDSLIDVAPAVRYQLAQTLKASDAMIKRLEAVPAGDPAASEGAVPASSASTGEVTHARRRAQQSAAAAARNAVVDSLDAMHKELLEFMTKFAALMSSRETRVNELSRLGGDYTERQVALERLLAVTNEQASAASLDALGVSIAKSHHPAE